MVLRLPNKEVMSLCHNQEESYKQLMKMAHLFQDQQGTSEQNQIIGLFQNILKQEK
jgi:hypothetical protein